MANANSGSMVDDFENAFQACLCSLTNQDHFNIHDSEEVKSGAEQTLQRFLDMAKHMECFFLQKRLLLSAQKPEQIIREDINELKLELARKEQLIQKHYEKIQYWQSLLSDLQGPGRPMTQPPPPAAAQPQASAATVSNLQPPPPQAYGPGPVLPQGQSPMGPPHPGNQANAMSGLQGPLAYLEKTTSNIGVSELRR